MSLRLAFMGTPAFSVGALTELVAAGHEVAVVYTQPPRRAGRGQSERQSPVHQQAEKLGLAVRMPASFKDPEAQEAFAALDLDTAIVVAYGQILPQAVLDAPQFGCLNLHASLLPRWRGAAPIQRAVMAGDTLTGVQVMQMEAGLDTGPILLSETTPIADDETAGSLHDRLALIGAQMLPRALAALERGSLTPTPQASDGVTYAHKIDKQEARVDWRRPAREVDFQIRGLSPFPGAWFYLDAGEARIRVKALHARREAANVTAVQPGQILDGGLLVACGEDAVRLTRVQREGRTPQTTEDFLRGVSLGVGAQLS